MPRKKNRRKEIQKAKQADEVANKPRVGIITHTPNGGSGAALAMAIAKAFPDMIAVDVDATKEDLA